MMEEVALLDEMDDSNYRNLWENLTAISESELEWQPHPQANDLRWILGHLIWFEEWSAGALSNTGRYLTDKGRKLMVYTAPKKSGNGSTLSAHTARRRSGG